MSDDHHLANKYRPTRFSDVIGQASTVGSILGAIRQGKLRPGLLLHGPHSTGKTSIARLYALYLSCLNPGKSTKEPCGECQSCILMKSVLFGRSNHPDVTEMNAALHGGIDRIRQLETLAPQAPRFRNRVFIMDEAHQITGAAFNGALKLLEDPPARTKFVFCTTNPEKLPDAIWSRCQCFKLEPLTHVQVAKRLYTVALSEKFKPSSPEVLKQLCMRIAAASHGHLRDALGLLDNAINYAYTLRDTDAAGNIDDIITEVTSHTPALGSYDAARLYCKAMFDGDLKQASAAILGSNNIDYMVRNIIEIFQLVMYQAIDESLLDPSRLSLIRGVLDRKGQCVISTSGYGKVLGEYVAASERIKLYAVDAAALLQALTLQHIDSFRGGVKDA